MRRFKVFAAFSLCGCASASNPNSQADSAAGQSASVAHAADGSGISGGSGGTTASGGSVSSGGTGKGVGGTLGTGATSASGGSVGNGGTGIGGKGSSVGAPFDWVGVVGTGQSLGVGYTINGGPALSTTQPFHNLKLLDSGPDPKYPTDGSGNPVWSAVPLTEPMRPPFPNLPSDTYPNNIYGETPHSGMANTLSMIWKSRTGGDYVSVHSDVALGGRALIYINKRTASFQAGVNEARVFTRLARAAGKAYGVAGIILTHGEADASNPTYGDGVYQLLQDYDAALKGATGQTRDVVLFATQESSIDGSDSSAVQLWRVGAAHPGQVVVVGPKYQYGYSDNVHLTQAGYVRLGQKYGEIFDQVVNQGVAWKPVGPSRVTRSGTTLTIDFDVPNPPLTWDLSIDPPHQQVHNAWANGRGFEVRDSGGREVTISSVQITGDKTVVLTLGQNANAPLTLSYAVTGDASGCCWGGQNNGPHGQLRDSDPFIGYDAESIPVRVTSGSAQVSAAATALAQRTGRDIVEGSGLPADTVVIGPTTNGLLLSAPWSGQTGTAVLSFHHDHHNYCVHFSMPVP